MQIPTEKQLIAARQKFRELMEAGAPEREWQKFFAANPYVLSSGLPLKLLPCDIHAMGRPGRSEPDFLIYPGSPASQSIFGVLELKTPYAKLITEPRRAIFELSRDLRTAARQVREYDRNFDRYAPDTRCFGFTNRSFQFVVMGSSAEILALQSNVEFRRQMDELLPPDVRILTFDELLTNYEQHCPKPILVAVPEGQLINPTLGQIDQLLGHTIVTRRVDAMAYRVIPVPMPPVGYDEVNDLGALMDDFLWNPKFGDRQHAIDLVREPFERPQISQFSDGSFGVFYSSDSTNTAMAEALRHFNIYTARFGGSTRRQQFSLYRVVIHADLHDVTAAVKVARQQSPVAEDSALHALGAQLRAEGSDGVIYRSKAEGIGNSMGVFSMSAIEGVAHVHTFRIEDRGGGPRMIDP